MQGAQPNSAGDKDRVTAQYAAEYRGVGRDVMGWRRGVPGRHRECHAGTISSARSRRAALGFGLLPRSS
jgi:hypothetical protein